MRAGKFGAKVEFLSAGRVCVPPSIMSTKKFAPLLLVAALLCGCAHYDMKLTNGMKIINVRKPVVNKATGQVDYTDAAGNRKHISIGHVVEIEPHRRQSFTSPTEQ